MDTPPEPTAPPLAGASIHRASARHGGTPLRVAIIGAGPAGSALAVLLAERGAAVTLFDDGRRPALLVGESLVPAVVPILRRLGIERETASFSCLKPGVSFLWSPTITFGFSFARFAPGVFPYAYNIPRPRFDEALLARAVASGARHVITRAELDRGSPGGPGPELRLTAGTLAAAPWLEGAQPDLVVDASGRARRGARALGIAARVGPRRDVAHFAHFQGVRWEAEAGQVLIARGHAGWSWRIPLQDRVSVGIVLGQDDAARLGQSPEARLEAAIASDPWLAPAVGAAARVSEVATYANYQLISERGHGPGWVMVGDAFGFVDPMLSPGVFLALRSAEMVCDGLAPALAGAGRAPDDLARALAPYAAAQTASLAAWTELVSYLYDGHLVALIRSGQDFVAGRVASGIRTALQNHIERQVALQASGMGTTSRYSRRLLRVLNRYGLRGVKPGPLAIR